MNNIILASQQAQMDYSFLIMMVLMFAIMWFLIIRPQRKRQKEIQAFQNSLQNGTSVVTGGGIYGTVKNIDLTRNTVDVEIAKNVVITVDRGFVYQDTASQQAVK